MCPGMHSHPKSSSANTVLLLAKLAAAACRVRTYTLDDPVQEMKMTDKKI